MSTKRQVRRQDYKYCLDCGRKFKSDKDKHRVKTYEPRDCTYNMTEDHKRTGRVICGDCHGRRKW